MKPRLEQLWKQATADKKKLGLMVALFAVGLLMWGRLMLKQVPRVATANDQQIAAADDTQTPLRSGRSTVTLALPAPLERDLFALEAERYRMIPVEKKQEVVQQKLPTQRSDESVRRAVIDDARSLRLQSVTLGEVPAAFINGRLVRLNGTIDGFTLLHCDERSAVLEKDGTRIRIRM